MEQKSAVEWLVDKLSNYDQEMLFLYEKEIEQAKQMENENIKKEREEAYSDGYINGKVDTQYNQSFENE